MPLATEWTLGSLADWHVEIHENVGVAIARGLIDEGDDAEILRFSYTSGDCEAFATALAELTGWPKIRVQDAGIGPVHTAIESPDGRVLDAAGWTTRAEIEARYDLDEPVWSGPSHDLGDLAGSDEVVEDGVLEETAAAVAAIRLLPGAPFDDPDFQARYSSQSIAGVDYAADDDELCVAP